MSAHKNIVVVMGMTGAGKSYLIQELSGQSCRVGDGLASCTSSIQAIDCVISGQSVTLVDTPGFDDTNTSDEAILAQVGDWLASMINHKVCGIIYLHSILENRVRGRAYKNLQMFKTMCGEEALQNVVLLTNRWGMVDESTALAREIELKTSFWEPYVRAGCRMARYRTRADLISLVGSFLSIAPTVMGIQKEMVYERKAATQTTAGAFVRFNSEVQATREFYKARFADEEAQHNATMATLKRQRDEYRSALEKVEKRYASLAFHNPEMLYDSSKEVVIQMQYMDPPPAPFVSSSSSPTIPVTVAAPSSSTPPKKNVLCKTITTAVIGSVLGWVIYHVASN